MATETEEERLAKLKEVIQSGLSETQSGTERVKFMPYSDLRQVEADMERKAAKRKARKLFRMRGGSGY